MSFDRAREILEVRPHRIPDRLDRRIGNLADRWLVARDGLAGDVRQVEPDPALASRLEWRLYTLLVERRPGVVFNIGGLALWADARIAGRVEARAMVEI